MDRIEIVGLPGAGKTSLAISARSEGLVPLLEQYRANPFWARAMSGHASSWFASDVVFHLQHMDQILHAESESGLHIADFSIWQDAFYAARRATPQQAIIYESLHRYVRHAVGEPIAYVFIDLSAHELMERTAARGRPEEQCIQLLDVMAAVDALRVAVSGTLVEQGKIVLTHSMSSTEALVRELKRFASERQAKAE